MSAAHVLWGLPIRSLLVLCACLDLLACAWADPQGLPVKPIICENATRELDERLRYFELQARLRKLERTNRLSEARVPWRLLLRLGWVVVGLWEAYRKWRQ